MHDAYNAFRECGWAAWLCLLIGFSGALAGLAGVVLLATKARGAAWIVGSGAAALGALSLVVGLLGRQTGLSRMEGALSGESIDPSQKARIRVVGTEEANQCIAVGAATGSPPFVLGALAVAIGLALRKKSAG